MAERVQVLTLCCTTIRAEYYHWQVRLLLLTVLVEFFSKLQGKTHNFQMDPRSRPFIVVGGSKRSPCYWKYAYAIGGREKVFFSLLSDAYLVAKSVVLPTPSSGHLRVSGPSYTSWTGLPMDTLVITVHGRRHDLWHRYSKTSRWKATAVLFPT